VLESVTSRWHLSGREYHYFSLCTFVLFDLLQEASITFLIFKIQYIFQRCPIWSGNLPTVEKWDCQMFTFPLPRVLMDPKFWFYFYFRLTCDTSIIFFRCSLFFCAHTCQIILLLSVASAILHFHCPWRETFVVSETSNSNQASFWKGNMSIWF